MTGATGMAGLPELAIEEVGPLAAPLIAVLTEETRDPWGADILAGLMAAPGSLCVLAREGEQPVGFLLARVAAEEAEILNFIVRRSHRRLGVGGVLLLRLLSAVRDMGAQEIFLEVASDNTAARRLYENAGFQQVGVRPDYYREGRVNYADALILRRELITEEGD